MLAVSVVHRRLAELELINRKRSWTIEEVHEVKHCLRLNANLVQRLDELKNLAFVAHCASDYKWEMEICGDIEELEVKLI